MLSFITFKDAPEQLEIVADDQGIEELINYLEGIKRDQDHMHLIIDSEINPYPISQMREGKTLYAKHVRLEYSSTSSWDRKGE